MSWSLTSVNGKSEIRLTQVGKLPFQPPLQRRMMGEVTFENIQDYLVKHFSEYLALEIEVRDLQKMVNVMWGEIVHRTGEMNLKNDWHGLDKRLREIEERMDGMENYLSNSLKRKETYVNKKTKGYNYE